MICLTVPNVSHLVKIILCSSTITLFTKLHFFRNSVDELNISILDFIREDLLAHVSFPFWLLTLIGQFIVCAKKRAKADDLCQR